MGFLDPEMIALIIGGAVLVGATCGALEGKGPVVCIVALIVGALMLVFGLADLLLDALER